MAALPYYGQLRIFVSSTFQDMTEERNILVSRVFPRVQAYCRARHIEFIGVDLRWGITDEQGLAGQTVPICMAEIDRCRPLFLGMLGERYGWVPEDGTVSVTEREIEYGALQAPAGTEAFFCLRDPALTEALTGPFRTDPRLDLLKKRVRESGYPVLDGYQSLEDFAGGVYAFLTGAVDRLAPAINQADDTERMRREQWFLASHYAADFAGRADALARLETAATTGGLVLLTGEPGVGKRTLLSAWALKKKSENTSLFLYYAGHSTGGWEQAAAQLIRELSRDHLPGYPVPEDAEGLRRSVSVLLGLLSGKGIRVLLLIDSVQQLVKKDGFGLSWLPRELPEGITAVLTVNDGETLDILRQRPHREVSLHRFTPEEIGQVTEEYLGFWSKSISREQAELLRASEAAQLPLYLITLLNEIRQRGRHETLSEELRKYLACDDIRALTDRVLERLDREYGDRLAERFLSLLLAAPDGLTEAELILLLGDLPQARFAPLYLELLPFTTFRSGALFPGNGILAETARTRYGITGDTLLSLRRELVCWYAEQPELPRRALVLPALLDLTGDLPALYEQIRQPDVFAVLWQKSREETRELWHQLKDAGYLPEEGYAAVFADPDTYPAPLLSSLARFLTETGSGAQAMTLLQALLKADRPAETRIPAARLAGNLLQQAGHPDRAEQCYRLWYRLARETGDRYEQQRALGNIGLIRQQLGDNAAAKDAFETVCTLAEKLNQSDAVQTALGCLGNVALSMGDSAEAERLYLRQKAVCTDSGNVTGRIAALGALGILYCRRRRYDEAEQVFREQYDESTRIQAADGIANALGNLAAMEAIRGNRAEAKDHYMRKLALCRETGQFSGEQSALANLTELLSKEGRHEEALGYARERAELTRAHRAFRQYAQALMALAKEEEALGQARDAEMHCLQADAIARQHGFLQ